MAKQNGLGDALYVGGTDVSGDINSLSSISGSQATIDVTDITQSAHSRLGGQRDGMIEFVSYFDPALAHPVFSALPTSDVVVMYCRGTALGGPCAAMVAKQLNYDGSRSQSGEFTFKVSAQANAFGLEWGVLLTPGMRTDTAATNGSSIDTLASASFGGQAYLEVASVTGTSVTLTIQDSADNSTFAAVTSFAFAAATPGASPQSQRIAIGNTATLRRYIRVVSTGTFTNAVFAVALVKNPIAGVTF